MKVKRLKRSRKMSQFYINTFGFKEPVRVLVDGTFCQAALTTKMHLQEQVPAYLGIRAQLVTTKCCVDEIVALGEDFRGAKLVARRFEQHKCRCRGLGGGAEACVLALIGEKNREHYIVATQDSGLKDKLKLIPGVPVLSIKFGQLVLGKPSQASLDKAAELNRLKAGIMPPNPQPKEVASDSLVVRKRKRKQPNPLSCKKKNTAGKSDSGAAKKKNKNRK